MWSNQKVQGTFSSQYDLSESIPLNFLAVSAGTRREIKFRSVAGRPANNKKRSPRHPGRWDGSQISTILGELITLWHSTSFACTNVAADNPEKYRSINSVCVYINMVYHKLDASAVVHLIKRRCFCTESCGYMITSVDKGVQPKWGHFKKKSGRSAEHLK